MPDSTHDSTGIIVSVTLFLVLAISVGLLYYFLVHKKMNELREEHEKDVKALAETYKTFVPSSKFEDSVKQINNNIQNLSSSSTKSINELNAYDENLAKYITEFSLAVASGAEALQEAGAELDKQFEIYNTDIGDLKTRMDTVNGVMAIDPLTRDLTLNPGMSNLINMYAAKIDNNLDVKGALKMGNKDQTKYQVQVKPDNGELQLHMVNGGNTLGIYKDEQQLSRIDEGGNVVYNGNSCIKMGGNIANKNADAGSICYQKTTPDTLEIVGAGTTSSGRKVKILDELHVPKIKADRVQIGEDYVIEKVGGSLGIGKMDGKLILTMATAPPGGGDVVHVYGNSDGKLPVFYINTKGESGTHK